ncbi:uncharacterized protein LOC133151502 [Syngnathus typhle]|uniref:uncharacterized protein LOC133151502 n=1 Tax=Syngnathus typhle TaxID=161592 RepID=UPI002A6A1253|nr:uncharacterized protein LOC133151502 [Syngnathus typhle]
MSYSTGFMMSGHSTDFGYGRKESHKNNCSTNGANVSSLFKERTLSFSCPSAPTRTSLSTKTDQSNVTKPRHVANGYLNHDKASNAAPVRAKSKETFLAAGGIAVNGTTGEPHVLATSEQRATKPGPLVTAKVKTKRRIKIRRKVFIEGTQCILRGTKLADRKKLTLQPPEEEEEEEEEDWEKECEAHLQKTLALQPYGPEDAFAMAFQDLRVKQWEDVPNTASYNPAIHHPGPLRLFRSRIAIEPEQFADA